MLSDSDSETSTSLANAVAFDDEIVRLGLEITWSLVVLFANRKRRRWGSDGEIVVMMTGTWHFFMTMDKLVGGTMAIM